MFNVPVNNFSVIKLFLMLVMYVIKELSVNRYFVFHVSSFCSVSFFHEMHINLVVSIDNVNFTFVKQYIENSPSSA